MEQWSIVDYQISRAKSQVLGVGFQVSGVREEKRAS
jgi:hypothetical protein